MCAKSPIKNSPSGEPERQRPLRGRGLRFIPGGFWEKSGAWRLRERVSGSDYIRFLEDKKGVSPMFHDFACSQVALA